MSLRSVGEGRSIVAPRGMEHLLAAEEEVYLLLVEPGTTQSMGHVENERMGRYWGRL